MEHKMVFPDIDGTLIGSSQRIPGSAARAIKKSQANGHLMLICTGRAIPEIGPQVLGLGVEYVWQSSRRIWATAGYSRAVEDIERHVLRGP